MHKEVVRTALEKIAVLMQGISIVRPDLESKDALGIAEKVADISATLMEEKLYIS